MLLQADQRGVTKRRWPRPFVAASPALLSSVSQPTNTLQIPQEGQGKSDRLISASLTHRMRAYCYAETHLLQQRAWKAFASLHALQAPLYHASPTCPYNHPKSGEEPST